MMLQAGIFPVTGAMPRAMLARPSIDAGALSPRAKSTVGARWHDGPTFSQLSRRLFIGGTAAGGASLLASWVDVHGDIGSSMPRDMFGEPKRGVLPFIALARELFNDTLRHLSLDFERDAHPQVRTYGIDDFVRGAAPWPSRGKEHRGRLYFQILGDQIIMIEAPRAALDPYALASVTHATCPAAVIRGIHADNELLAVAHLSAIAHQARQLDDIVTRLVHQGVTQIHVTYYFPRDSEALGQRYAQAAKALVQEHHPDNVAAFDLVPAHNSDEQRMQMLATSRGAVAVSFPKRTWLAPSVDGQKPLAEYPVEFAPLVPSGRAPSHGVRQDA